MTIRLLFSLILVESLYAKSMSSFVLFLIIRSLNLESLSFLQTSSTSKKHTNCSFAQAALRAAPSGILVFALCNFNFSEKAAATNRTIHRCIVKENNFPIRFILIINRIDRLSNERLTIITIHDYAKKWP